jgi:hypothetical protein
MLGLGHRKVRTLHVGRTWIHSHNHEVIHLLRLTLEGPERANYWEGRASHVAHAREPSALSHARWGSVRSALSTPKQV